MIDLKLLLQPGTTFAVIGASDNSDKYGYKVYKDLKSKGYEVYPINIHDEKVQGDRAYKSISELPKKVDVLNFIIPPSASLEVVKESLALGYKVFWFQPGASDSNILSFLNKKEGVTVVSDQCVILQTGRK